jgi:integrase
MVYSRFDPAMQSCSAWNAGKTVGKKRTLTQKQIWAIWFHLDREGRLRARSLFDLAIDSKLRGCDLVKIKIGDLIASADIRTRAIVVQQKTGRPVQFELTADVRSSLMVWLDRRGGTLAYYVFPSRIDHANHMSTRQYARRVDEWVTAIGLSAERPASIIMRKRRSGSCWRGCAVRIASPTCAAVRVPYSPGAGRVLQMVEGLYGSRQAPPCRRHVACRHYR